MCNIFFKKFSTSCYIKNNLDLAYSLNSFKKSIFFSIRIKIILRCLAQHHNFSLKSSVIWPYQINETFIPFFNLCLGFNFLISSSQDVRETLVPLCFICFILFMEVRRQLYLYTFPFFFPTYYLTSTTTET